MKRCLLCIVCALMAVCLCGCDYYVTDTDKLLSPPRLSGDLYPIQQALIDSIDGDYTLKYPTTGDIKSAVITEDIDNDGVKEAFAFYSTTDGEQTLMHLNTIVKKNGKYKSVDDCTVEAADVEQINFSDLDGDGKKEIIVGWEVYANSEKQLSLYEYSFGLLTKRMSQKYTNFICCDLDENGVQEILVQELDTTKSENKASVYVLTDEGVSQTAGCMMDGAVKTVGKFKLSKLSTGKPAVYIDETKGIGAVTEVLFLVKGELKNPLLDSVNTMENITTVRSATIGAADINSDGIMEIPIASDMPCADAGATEKLYYTNWCSFNGEALTVKQVAIVNTVDGYSINIPTRWISNISVLKNTEKRTRTIYVYDSQTKTTKEKIITFKAVDREDYLKEKDKSKLGKEIYTKGDTVFLAERSLYKGNLSITDKELKSILSFDSF